MKIRTWKNVEVEVEVEVTIEDLITECFERAAEAEGEQWKYLLTPIDGATRFLKSIRQETINAMTDEVRQIVYDRLIEEAERFKPSDETNDRTTEGKP